MANKIGPLLKEARTQAGLTQEKLASKIKGLSAADISRAERGELELSQAMLREIAKVTGVTQASLINAAKASTYKKAGSAKPAATAGKTSAAKSAYQVTAEEKKLIQLYRKADAGTREQVMKLLSMADVGGMANELVSNFLGSILNKK